MDNVVTDHVRQAYAALREDRWRVLRIAAAPAVVIVIAGSVPDINALLSQATGFLALLAYIVLAVRVHRHILLVDAENGHPATAMLHVRFGFWVIVPGLIASVLMLPTVLFGATSAHLFLLLLLLALVPALYFVARVSLVLPDRALGYSAPLGEVWKWSAGNGWKLVAVLFLPPFLINAVISLATFGAPEELAELLSVIATIPILIFEVALLSCAYRGLKRQATTV